MKSLRLKNGKGLSPISEAGSVLIGFSLLRRDLCQKDITDIIKFATQNNVLTVVSNGTMITKELAEKIVESGLGYIHISVDGIKAETHDYIRGISGLMQKRRQE